MFGDWLVMRWSQQIIFTSRCFFSEGQIKECVIDFNSTWWCSTHQHHHHLYSFTLVLGFYHLFLLFLSALGFLVWSVSCLSLRLRLSSIDLLHLAWAHHPDLLHLFPPSYIHLSVHVSTASRLTRFLSDPLLYSLPAWMTRPRLWLLLHHALSS